MPSAGAEDAPYDVCVVGGGPAGSSLALRLAQLGRRVAVIEKSTFPRLHVGESLAPGIRPLLDVLELSEVVSSAGFLPSGGATVAWGGERRQHPVQGSPALLVDRSRFDALLLQKTAEMPTVRLFQPARVRAAARREGCWTLDLDSGQKVRALYLADAAGGARLRLTPPTDAGGGERRALGARTVALYAYWQQSDPDAGTPAASETLVESGHEAWYWGAQLPGGLFNAMVFVDPGGRRDYEALLGQSQLLSTRLRGNRRVSRVRACDATPSAAVTPVTPTFIRVGDAALFVDPISSQGVQAAIGTALHAAIVLNTLIDNPDDAELALAFYHRRVRESSTFHAAAAAGFYRAQADSSEQDFWLRRAHAAETAAAAAAAERLSGPSPGAPTVPLSPASRVTRALDVVFSPVSIASASHVTRTAGIVAGGKEYAFVGRGIRLAPLLEQIDAPLSAFDVVARWSRTIPPQEALEILQWAWREALIAPAAGASPSCVRP